jgi:hypothetical protein
MNQFVRAQIEHFDERIVLASKEQSVTLEIHRKVVKIAFLGDTRHWNGLT